MTTRDKIAKAILCATAWSMRTRIWAPIWRYITTGTILMRLCRGSWVRMARSGIAYTSVSFLYSILPLPAFRKGGFFVSEGFRPFV